jgi:PTH1 family peptidyl-tRNA hydrolase
VTETIPKTILCLGNPGAEYSMTRHNVAWWLADRLADRFSLGRFREQGNAAVAQGRAGTVAIQVVKPLTYMNRSGRVLTGLAKKEGFDLVRDLLVVVDEMALDVGRIRFRPGGSAGGHNGLKSVQESLGTMDYARLRIGIGAPHPGANKADWVLAAVPRADREVILNAMDGVVDCVERWFTDGIEAAMNRCNQ